MRALSLALLALAACTYSAETPAVTVHIDGIPQEADRLDVTLQDSTSADPQHPKYERFPHFGQGAQPSIDVVFPEPAAGAYRVDVVAMTRDLAQVAKGHSDPTAAYPGTPDLQITMARTTGVVGAFGTPCNPSGSPSCLAGLECKVFQTGDVGICTHTCTGASDCSGVTPAASCAAFPGGTANYCLWNCTSSGQSACPSDLTCRALGSTGSSYCQGS